MPALTPYSFNATVEVLVNVIKQFRKNKSPRDPALASRLPRTGQQVAPGLHRPDSEEPPELRRAKSPPKGAAFPGRRCYSGSSSKRGKRSRLPGTKQVLEGAPSRPHGFLGKPTSPCRRPPPPPPPSESEPLTRGSPRPGATRGRGLRPHPVAPGGKDGVRPAERRPPGYDYRQRRPPGSRHVLAGGVDAGQGAVARVASELPSPAPRRPPWRKEGLGALPPQGMREPGEAGPPAGGRLSTPGPALPLTYGFPVGAGNATAAGADKVAPPKHLLGWA
ncbi:formin-like protein 5 [Eumetopias jubatus]|uniref:formin-like protein 5 n=1 Tax=Eumetopias jubatus TaxID=34886 RepID=UPI001015DE92|nr:formin-like protein 5 [Eumetopias jubatus]